VSRLKVQIAASGTGSERAKVASVSYEEAARKPLAAGGETPQGIGPIRDRIYETQRLGEMVRN
jgi:hypothetical protein